MATMLYSATPRRLIVTTASASTTSGSGTGGGGFTSEFRSLGKTGAPGGVARNAQVTKRKEGEILGAGRKVARHGSKLFCGALSRPVAGNGTHPPGRRTSDRGDALGEPRAHGVGKVERLQRNQ